MIIIKSFKHIIFLLKEVLKSPSKALKKIHLYLIRKNWQYSKNGNLYNPTIKATVYQSGSEWSIARCGVHYSGFLFKKQAMNIAFETWLDHKKEFSKEIVEKKLFEKACYAISEDPSCPGRTSHLASMYLHGVGVEKDESQAKELYALAANEGYGPALDVLAQLKEEEQKLDKKLEEWREKGLLPTYEEMIQYK